LGGGLIWACSADLGIFFGFACGFDAACICATRFVGRTGRSTATGGWYEACASVGASSSKRWRIFGELDEHGRIEARALASRLIGTPEQAPLFDDGNEHQTVPVRLKGIRIERSRQFRDVYLALALWRGTGLEDLCERLLPIGSDGDVLRCCRLDGALGAA
jgi:hypothetical protein